MKYVVVETTQQGVVLHSGERDKWGNPVVTTVDWPDGSAAHAFAVGDEVQIVLRLVR